MPGNGPGTSIEILVDASQVSTGIAQAENALKGGLERIASSGRTAASGTDVLEKSFGRLAHTRTPNFLSQVNSQLISQIPLVRDNAAAMTLLQTAGFGVTGALTSLLGPVGAIILGVATLATLAVSLTSTKENLTKLTDEALKSADIFSKIAAKGFDVSRLSLENLERQLALSEGQLMLFQGGLVELEQTGKGSSKNADELRTKIGELQVKIDDLGASISKIKLAPLAESEKSVSKFTEELGESFKKTHIETIGFDAAIGSLGSAFSKLRMSKPEDSPTFKLEQQIKKAKEQVKEINKLSNQAIQNVEDTSNAAAKGVRDVNQTTIDEITKSKAAFQNLFAPLKSAFADALMGIEVQWGKLLERMAAELIASAIFKILESFLFPGGGGFNLFGLKLQSGADFIPRTQLAVLHRGEAVVPSYQNSYNQSRNNFGASTIIINNYGAAATNSKKIAESIRRAFQRREFEI